MADLKTKLFTLAGIATMFAGFAHAQATFTAANQATATVGFIRAEGTTEILPATTVNLQNSVAGTMTITVYLSPSVAITSETFNHGTSEITATSNGANGNTVNGTVSGSTITFAGIQTTAGGATTTVTIANIRVNASSLPAANGVPTGISELIFLSGANAVPGSYTLSNLAYVLNGLGSYSVPGGGNPGAAAANLVCSSVGASTLQFTLNVPENFSQAFKTLAQESGTNANAPATNGTRLAITIGNISAGISVYVPLTVATSTAGGTGQFTLISSPTATNGAANYITTAVTGLNPNAPVPVSQVTIANGTGTAYYELTTATTAGVLESYPFNFYYVSKAAALTSPATAASLSVSFAPIGASSNYPNFVVGSNTTTINSGSTYGACTTTLLFPFVTNQLGFDTGIAISNTSSDLLAKGGTASQAAAQTGTCSMTFFGNTAPAAVNTGSVAAGTSYAAAASSVAPGFQGYMIASCNFLYAHGFAYVVYNLTQNNGAAMGYLADVIPGNRTSPISTPTASFTPNGGGGFNQLTNLTFSNTVSANNPESWGH